MTNLHDASKIMRATSILMRIHAYFEAYWGVLGAQIHKYNFLLYFWIRCVKLFFSKL